MFINENNQTVAARELFISNLQEIKSFDIIAAEGYGKSSIVADGLQISEDRDDWKTEIYVDFSAIMSKKIFVAPVGEMSSGSIRIEDFNE